MRESSGFKDLKVWQKAMDLVVKVYRFTRKFPKEELYGLTSQLRRASVSVAANIAEGTGRSTKGEFIHFLSIARGSAKEVDTLSRVASRLGLIPESLCDEIVSDADEIARMAYGLQQRLRRGK